MIKIAFIDSDNSTRELYAHLLEAAGYQVMQATTAQYGLWLCRESHPDLIITTRDPVDAELEQDDFVRVLRRVAGPTPIVVVSHGKGARFTNGYGNGAESRNYLEMMSAIHRALDEVSETAAVSTSQNGVSAMSS